MAFPTITVYGESSNTNTLRLFENKVPVNLKLVKKIRLELDNRAEIDSERNPGVFDWWTGARGVLKMQLGFLWWPTAVYYSKLVVYDELNFRGVFWGAFRIRSLENTVPI